MTRPSCSLRRATLSAAAGLHHIDFAYAIHSEVGNKMIGAKINGMIVPIDKIPQNGEIVEILTSSASHGPSHPTAQDRQDLRGEKQDIRQWFKREKRSENIEVGRAEIEREFLRYPRKATEDQKNEIVPRLRAAWECRDRRPVQRDRIRRTCGGEDRFKAPR